MSDRLDQRLSVIKTFIFDLDGVLTDGSLLITEAGEELRTMNVKDGNALRIAADKGYKIFVISGANAPGVRGRLSRLGVSEIFLGINNKKPLAMELINKHEIDLMETLYMGDDLPDLEIMLEVGFRACPNDAAVEVLQISDYICEKNGGKGAAREIIEKVLRIQNNWPD